MMLTSKKTRGFTLLELTMVLMVVGAVTAAIWASVDRVWTSYRVYRVTQQINHVSQNIRDYYGTSVQVLPWANGTDITKNLDGLLPNVEIYPSEMRRDPTLAPGSAGVKIDHAINNSFAGGSFHVLSVNNASTFANTAVNRLDAFRFKLQGLSATACMQLLMALPLSSDTIGFVQVQTDVAGPAVITKGVSPTAGVTPMTAPTAKTWCTGATEVDLDFALSN